jgi:CelD/BcsL family acetyltransferase involved in cellulose biosynthesis
LTVPLRPGVAPPTGHESASARAGRPLLTLLPLEGAEWLGFVSGCREATPFHHPEWARLLADAYGYRSFALAVRREDGRPIAGAPFLEVRGLTGRRRWISLPFTDDCQPLATDQAAADDLVTAFSRAHATLGAPMLELRASVDALGWRCNVGAVTHLLDIEPDPAAVQRRFSRSQVIRNIRRAEREGVEVRTASSDADLNAFYGLHARTRQRQGVPVQPRKFFDLIWSRLVGRGLASILLASAGGPPLAGALFLHWNGTTIYKFGASDSEGLPLRPNHALFWTAIQESCARSDREFDFGRTDLGNEGLRRFKSAWGGAERPLVYSSLAPGAAEGREGTGARAAAVVIKRGPPWVGRAVGATLYRYAGSR